MRRSDAHIERGQKAKAALGLFLHPRVRPDDGHGQELKPPTNAERAGSTLIRGPPAYPAFAALATGLAAGGHAWEGALRGHKLGRRGDCSIGAAEVTRQLRTNDGDVIGQPETALSFVPPEVQADGASWIAVFSDGSSYEVAQKPYKSSPPPAAVAVPPKMPSESAIASACAVPRGAGGTCCHMHPARAPAAPPPTRNTCASSFTSASRPSPLA